MTDDISQNGFGVRLKKAREALDLSPKDAASKLHLSAHVLHDLETENFKDSPPTFMRGYLRSYARMLNFSDDEINTMLKQSGLISEPSAPLAPTLHTDAFQTSDRYVQWASTAVVLGLFIFVGTWWGFHSHSTAADNTQINVTTAQQPSATAIAEPVTQPQQLQAVAPSATTQTTAQTPVAAVAPNNTTLSPQQPATPVAPAPAPTTPIGSVTPTSPAATTLPTPQPAVPTTVAPVPGTALPGQPAIASTSTTTETSNKKQNHKQDNTVSGIQMALPEPGL